MFIKGKLPLKIPDIVIILLAFGLTGASAYTAYLKPQNTIQVLIQGQNMTWIYPADAEESIVVPGPLGNTIVQIRDSYAWVESSPCENQTCVASGRVRRLGAWAACLPNNVLLMIEGNDGHKDHPDSIAW